MSEYVAAISAVLFAVLGLVMAISPPLPKYRIVSIAFFLGLGVIAAIFTVNSIFEKNAENEILRHKIETLIGDKNFCFFEAKIRNPKDLDSRAQLMTVNNGDGAVSKLQFFISPYWVQGRGDMHPEAYKSLMPAAREITCPIGSNPIEISIRPGRYRIEFTPVLATRNNVGWYEVLTIEQSYDRLVTTADVFLSTGEIIRSRRPPEYVDW